jgi:hypothetical protein
MESRRPRQREGQTHLALLVSKISLTAFWKKPMKSSQERLRRPPLHYFSFQTYAKVTWQHAKKKACLAVFDGRKAFYTFGVDSLVVFRVVCVSALPVERLVLDGKTQGGPGVLERTMAAHACLPVNKALASFVPRAVKRSIRQEDIVWTDQHTSLLNPLSDLCKDCLQSGLLGSEYPMVTFSK